MEPRAHGDGSEAQKGGKDLFNHDKKFELPAGSKGVSEWF